MATKSIAALMTSAVLILGASAATASDRQASAALHNPNGELVGEVLIRDTAHGTLLRARLLDLPPGAHAFHIHEKGVCQPPFKSAGGHYNPDDLAHGLDDPNGHHAGDMPNVHVPANGKTKLAIRNQSVTVGELLDADDGTAIVIHAGADDYSTDPAGAAGSRIACGVIVER